MQSLQKLFLIYICLSNWENQTTFKKNIKMRVHLTFSVPWTEIFYYFDFCAEWDQGYCRRCD